MFAERCKQPITLSSATTSGHNHGRALRGVCDRLVTILMAILQSGKPYNPGIRRGSSCATAGLAYRGRALPG
jgi:hypothetical protein